MNVLFDPVAQAINAGSVDAGVVVSGIGVAVAAAVGVGQIWAIWSGIRQMQKASAERAEQFNQQTAEGERRHQEMMQSLADQRLALETLIERTAAPPPAPLVVL